MADPQIIDYVAVLADLERKRAELDAAIAGIKVLLGQPASEGDGGGSPPGGPGGGSRHPHDAYLGMSIPEATKKHLTTVRKKVPTRDLMIALEKGGLPKSSYNSVYAVLRRRERGVGDIINMDGDWALAEWYPNHPKPKKGTKPETTAPSPKEKAKEPSKERDHKDPKAQKESDSKAPKGSATA